MKNVDCLAYKLDVPLDWQIYLVFSVIQLEPISLLAKDSFAKFFLSNFFPMFVKGDTNNLKSFEVKKLLNKQ